MSKKPIIGGIILAAIIGVVFVGAQINPDNPENKEQVVFHVTLADPALYDREGGLYSGYIKGLEEGWYEFRFVTSGDSPHRLSIELWQLDGRSAVVQNVFLDEYVKRYKIRFADSLDLHKNQPSPLISRVLKTNKEIIISSQKNPKNVHSLYA